MKIGVTGHQHREGIDWRWVRVELEAAISAFATPVSAYASLAEGADQVFADVALSCGAELVAVIPTDSYMDHFSEDGRATYTSLLEKARVIELSLDLPDEEAFLRAGQYIVDSVQTLFAIWDGEPAQGIGGTADIVAYAHRKCLPIVHLDPLEQEVRKV